MTFAEPRTRDELIAHYKAVRARTNPPVPPSPMPLLRGPKREAATLYSVPIGPFRVIPRDWNAARDWIIVSTCSGSRVSLSMIRAQVARWHNVTVTDLISERRTANLVLPRKEAYWLCRQVTGRSLPEIGRLFGNRDHTTVLHGVRSYQALVDAGQAPDRRSFFGGVE